jgi:hypothetical protein
MNPEACNFNVWWKGTRGGIPKAGVLLPLPHKRVLELRKEEERWYNGNNGIRGICRQNCFQVLVETCEFGFQYTTHADLNVVTQKMGMCMMKETMILSI